MSKHICKNNAALASIAKQLLPQILEHKMICLSAPMGAGKTTFIKQIGIALGVPENEIHSPTYSIVNEYRGQEHTIFHFDFYRLKNLEEAYDLALEDYFSRDALCFLEWPEIASSLLPLPYLKITIATQGETRIFTTEIINFLDVEKIS